MNQSIDLYAAILKMRVQYVLCAMSFPGTESWDSRMRQKGDGTSSSSGDAERLLLVAPPGLEDGEWKWAPTSTGDQKFSETYDPCRSNYCCLFHTHTLSFPLGHKF